MQSTQRPTVFLLGLPGAGKTSVARSVAARLGGELFLLGDRLRRLARDDVSLARTLDAGQLAPEPLVESLLRQLAADAHTSPLLIDGYPRHSSQLKLAQAMFPNCLFVLLDVPGETAVVRLTTRRKCAVCGVTSSSDVTTCEECGSTAWHLRPEDRPLVSPHRLEEFRHHLEHMVKQVPAVRLVTIDADRPLQAVVDAVVCVCLQPR